MRRIGTIAAVTVAIALLVAIAGLTALWLFVDPNAYRPQIERLVKEKTGRELVLGGKLELKLFPWVALAVHDVRLGNPPGFGAQPFVAIDEARIEVRVLPLLAKRLVVRGLKISGLVLDLVSRGERNNWQDLGGTKQSTPPTSSGGGPQSAFVSGVDISKSSLVFHDEVKKSVTRLSKLEVHTGELGGGRPANLAMQFDYGDAQTPTLAHFKLAAQLLPAASAAAVALRKLDMGGDWFGAATRPAASAVQRPNPMRFSVRAAAIDLDTTAQTLAAPRIELGLGDLAASLSVAGSRVLSDRVISGRISVPKTSARQVLQSLQVTLPPMRDPHALSALALTANYRLTAEQAELTDLDMTLDQTRLQGHAAIVDLKRMAMGFDLTVDALDLDRYRAPASAKQPVPRAAPGAAKAAKAPTPLPVQTLKALQANGTLHVGRMTMAGVVLTELSLPLKANDGRVELGPAKAQLYGGACEADIALDARPTPAHWSINEHLRNVDLGPLLHAGFENVRLEGHAESNAVLAGVGDNDEALIRSLTGKLDASIDQGAINGIDLDYEMQRAAALLKRQPEPRRAAAAARTPFKTLRTSATVDKGVLKDDSLHLETGALRVQGAGTLDLWTEAVDFRVVASTNPAASAAQRTGPLGSLQSLQVPLMVRGTLTQPSVEPDLQGLLEGQVRQQVNDKLQLKGGDLRKQLGGKLQDLLKH